MKKIPEGYKETELGVIPQEWEIKQIDDVAEEIFLGLTSKVDYVENGGFGADFAVPIAGVLFEQYMNGKLSPSAMKQAEELQKRRIAYGSHNR